MYNVYYVNFYILVFITNYSIYILDIMVNNIIGWLKWVRKIIKLQIKLQKVLLKLLAWILMLQVMLQLILIALTVVQILIIVNNLFMKETFVSFFI